MPRVSPLALKLGFALLVSSLGLAFAARYDSRWLAGFLSTSACAAILIAAAHTLLQHRIQNGGAPNRLVDLIRAFSELFALTCLWAAASLFLSYGAAGLRWQHGWQYALLFFLLSLVHGAFVLLPNKLRAPERRMALVRWALSGLKIETFSVFVALAWLIGSGKIWTVRNDWLANDVFFGSGFAVLGLAYLLLRESRR